MEKSVSNNKKEKKFSYTESLKDFHIYTLDDYLNLIRIKNKLKSDRGIARILGVSQATVSAWRRGLKWPTDENMYDISIEAGMDDNLALIHLACWKSLKSESRKAHQTWIEVATKLHTYIKMRDARVNERLKM